MLILKGKTPNKLIEKKDGWYNVLSDGTEELYVTNEHMEKYYKNYPENKEWLKAVEDDNLHAYLKSIGAGCSEEVFRANYPGKKYVH